MIGIYKYSKVLFILLFITMMTLMAGGCGDQNDYRTFSFQKDDTRFFRGGVILEHPLFTFEYPASFGDEAYSKGLPDFGYNEERATEVGFSRHGNDNSKYLDESVIDIRVFKPGSWFPGVIDAKTAIEYTINALNKSGDFQILEQGQKTVAGLSAEFLHFITYSNIGNLRTDRDILTIYFDYKGFIWWIDMMSPLEEAQKEGPYFEHLLETFKFLAPYPEGLNVTSEK